MSSAQRSSDHESRLSDGERLAALSRTGLMEGNRQERFGRLARLATRVTEAPAAFVSVVDGQQRRLVAMVGMELPEETPAVGTFCELVVVTGRPVVVAEVGQDGSAGAELDSGKLGIVAYCGVPVFVAGQVVGAVAALDRDRREWSSDDVEALTDLAVLAETEASEQMAEKQQREQRRRVFGLTNRLPIGVYVCDPEGRLGYYNDRMADLWGFRPEPGTPEAEAFAAARVRVDEAPVAAGGLPCAAALANLEGAENRELQLGRDRSVLASSAVIRDRGGVVLGAAAVVHDVTLVRQAGRLRDELLSLVSHELRTPLTVINGVASLLDRRWEALQPEARSAAVADIVVAGRRMDRAVGNMLVLSRIEHEMAELEPLNVRQVVADALDEHLAAFPASEVTVRTGDASPVALGVESWLRLSLVNLLSNGELYGDRSEPMLLEAELGSAGEIVIRICNPGPPLSPEDYDRIFDPFYRRAATAITTPGAGLGLTVARRLTEAQGGSVVAGPRLDREGTLVTLALPAASGRNSDGPAPAGEGRSGSRRAGA